METPKENITEELLQKLPPFAGSLPRTCISGSELIALLAQPHIQVVDLPIVVITTNGPRMIHAESLYTVTRGSLYIKRDRLPTVPGHIDHIVEIDPAGQYYLDPKHHRQLTATPSNKPNPIDRFTRRIHDEAAKIAEAARVAAEEAASRTPKKEIQRQPLSPEIRELTFVAEAAKTAQMMTNPSNYCHVEGHEQALMLLKPRSLTMAEWCEEIRYRLHGDQKSLKLFEQLIRTRGLSRFTVDYRWVLNLFTMLDMDKTNDKQTIAAGILSRLTGREDKNISFGFSSQPQQSHLRIIGSRSSGEFSPGLKVVFTDL